jgi:hypothetical protein
MKKGGLILVVLFIFILVPSFVSASIYVDNMGDFCWKNSNGVTNCNPIPPELNCGGLTDISVGSNVAVMGATCNGNFDGLFYDGPNNEWHKASEEGTVGIGSTIVAGTAAGGNVAMFATYDSNSNYRRVYAYDIYSDDFAVEIDVDTGELIYTPIREVNMYAGTIGWPAGIAAGGNVAVFADGAENGEFYFYTAWGGRWNKQGYVGEFREVGAGDDFAVGFTQWGSSTKQYVYKGPWNQVVSDSYSGTFFGSDTAYDTSAFCVDGSCFVYNCGDECICDLGAPLITEQDSMCGLIHEGGVGAGNGMAMFSSEGCIKVYDEGVGGAWSNAPGPTGHTVEYYDGFVGLDVGGSVGAVLRNNTENSHGAYFIYDKHDHQFVSEELFFIAGEYYSSLPAEVLNPLAGGDKVVFVTYDIDDYTYTYRGYDSDGYWMTEDDPWNSVPSTNWVECSMDGVIPISSIFLDSEEYTDAGWGTDYIGMGQYCEGYSCCADLGRIPNSPPQIGSVSVNPLLVDPGVPVSLQASGVSDPDSSCGDYITSTIWRVWQQGVPDSDWFYDVQTATVNTNGFPFDAVYGAQFSVEDNLGGQDSMSTIYFSTDSEGLPPENYPPIAHIESITPNPVEIGDEVVFVGHGSDSDGYIVEYEWTIDGDVVGDENTYSISFLSAGEHAIGFKVRDNYGDWSSPAIRNLEVIQPPVGGENWLVWDSPVNQDLYSIDGFGDVFYAAGDDGALVKSVDGGETWIDSATLPGSAIDNGEFEGWPPEQEVVEEHLLIEDLHRKWRPAISGDSFIYYDDTEDQMKYWRDWRDAEGGDEPYLTIDIEDDMWYNDHDILEDASGDKIFWSDVRAGDWTPSIYMQNVIYPFDPVRITGYLEMEINFITSDMVNIINSIDSEGDWVVFSLQYIEWDYFNGIFAYNVNNPEVIVNVESWLDYYDGQIVKVSGNKVIWRVHDGGQDKIYLHDLGSGSTTEIISDWYGISSFDISGDIVVFTVGTPFEGTTVCTYDISDGSTDCISNDDPDILHSGVKIDGNLVTWKRIDDPEYGEEDQIFVHYLDFDEGWAIPGEERVAQDVDDYKIIILDDFTGDNQVYLYEFVEEIESYLPDDWYLSSEELYPRRGDGHYTGGAHSLKIKVVEPEAINEYIYQNIYVIPGEEISLGGFAKTDPDGEDWKVSVYDDNENLLGEISGSGNSWEGFEMSFVALSNIIQVRLYPDDDSVNFPIGIFNYYDEIYLDRLSLLINSPTSEEISEVSFVNEFIGVIASKEGLYLTNDGGASWEKKYSDGSQHVGAADLFEYNSQLHIAGISGGIGSYGSNFPDMNEVPHRLISSSDGEECFFQGGDDGHTWWSNEWTSLVDSSDYSEVYGSDFFYYSSDMGGIYPPSIRYVPNIFQNGDYEIYGWYPISIDFDMDVRVKVYYDGGMDEVSIDQTTGGDQWNYLGTYSMGPESDHAVFLRVTDDGWVTCGDDENEACPESVRVVADAFKFVHVASGEEFIVDNSDWCSESSFYNPDDDELEVYQLEHISSHHPSNRARNVWGDGNFIYMSTSVDGLHVYSVDANGILTHIDSHNPGNHGYGVWGDGNFIYLASGYSGLHVYSVDSNGMLTLMGSHDLNGGYGRDVWGDGNFIYVATDLGGGLQVYSVDAGGSLTFVDSSLAFSVGGYEGVWGDGNFIYVASDSYRALIVFSVDSNGMLTPIDSYYSYGGGEDVWGDGNFIYLAKSFKGLYVFSVDSDGEITYVDSHDPESTANDVWGDGNFIYLANGITGGGIDVYSVDAGGSLTHVDSHSPGSEGGKGVWGDGNFIYLAQGYYQEGNLHVYDIFLGEDPDAEFFPEGYSTMDCLDNLNVCYAVSIWRDHSDVVTGQAGGIWEGTLVAPDYDKFNWVEREIIYEGEINDDYGGVAADSYFSSGDLGWFVYYYEDSCKIIRYNGGVISVVAETDKEIYGIDFIEGTNIGYVVGENGVILKTTDGINWAEDGLACPECPDLYDIIAISESEIWAVGESGSIFKRLYNEPPYNLQINPSTGVHTNPNHPVTQYYLNRGDIIELIGYADDENSDINEMTFVWEVTDSEGEYSPLGGGYNLIFDSSDLDSGVLTFKMTVYDKYEMWASESMQIRVKPEVPVAPYANIESISVEPFDEDIQAELGNDINELVVTGCQVINFEGSGCDSDSDCYFEEGIESDDGYIVGYDWELDGEDLSSYESFNFVGRYLENSPGGDSHGVTLKVVDDDGELGEDNSWWLGDSRLERLLAIDADALPLNHPSQGLFICDNLCCGGGDCYDDFGENDWFEGDNTADEIEDGYCCGDDNGEFLLTGEVTKCCDSPDYAAITPEGCMESGSYLLAHYKFDYNFMDNTGNGHDGINHDVSFACGVEGQAGDFSGTNDYVEVTTDLLDSYDEFTISGWVKPRADNIVNTRHLLRKGAPSPTGPYGEDMGNRGFLTQLFYNPPRIFAYQSVGGNMQHTNTNGYLVHNNRWHHFAMAYKYDSNLDLSTVKLYVDGMPASHTPEKSYSGPPDLPNGAENLFIGRRYASTDEYNGLMDELKFYSIALDENAIQNLANEFGNPDDNCGGGSCFLEGTKITMADGSEKDIENVQVGEYVIGRDGKAEVYELENPIREDYYIVSLEDNTELKVTNEHPIYSRDSKEEGWFSIIPEATWNDAKMDVNRLTEDSEVLTLNGWTNIKEIKHINEKVQTYNLKAVEGSTFYAEGILVHNKPPHVAVNYLHGEEPPYEGGIPIEGGNTTLQLNESDTNETTQNDTKPIKGLIDNLKENNKRIEILKSQPRFSPREIGFNIKGFFGKLFSNKNECRIDSDCRKDENCLNPCGICIEKEESCNYYGCKNGDKDSCCSNGLECNWKNECICAFEEEENRLEITEVR